MHFPRSVRLMACSALLGSVPLTTALTHEASAASPAKQPPAKHHIVSSIRLYWKKMEARHAFHHLSEHGQLAMLNILNAQQLLAQNKTSAAIPALMEARTHLTAAANAEERFTALVSELHPLPGHIIKAQQNSTLPVTWVPVGGEFVASKTLTPEKKAIVATANSQLKAGNTQQAAQTLKIVGKNIGFVMALAPVTPTQGAINRAIVFAQNHNTAMAKEAVADALNNLVFVSEDIVTSNTASAASVSQSQ